MIDNFRRVLRRSPTFHLVITVGFFIAFFLLVTRLSWFDFNWVVVGTIVGIIAFIASRQRMSQGRREEG